MPLEAIFFDAHGTLVESGDLFYRANQRLFQRYGISFDYDTFIDLWIHGRGLEDALLHWDTHLKEHGFSLTADRLRDERWPIIHKNAALYVRAKEGAQTLIHRIRRLPQNIRPRLGIVSNNCQRETNYLLRIIGLQHSFSYVLCREEMHEPKPHPSGYIQIARRFNVHPQNCIVFEDSEKGVIAAKKAEMMCIAVPGYYRNRESFANADLIYTSMQDVRVPHLLGLFRNP